MVQVKSGCVREWLTCNSLGEVLPPFIWILDGIHLAPICQILTIEGWCSKSIICH